MNFLVDAQLPSGLARWLVHQGHTAQHIHDIGLIGAGDSTIWDHAVKIDAVIVTKDEDFAERVAMSTLGPTILWLRIGNATNRALLEWIEPRWERITKLLDAGNRLIEVR